MDPRHIEFRELLTLLDPENVQHRKINCIKTLRSITGEGLKETKDFFEQTWQPAILNGKLQKLQSVEDTQEMAKLRKEMDDLKSFVMQQWRIKDGEMESQQTSGGQLEAGEQLDLQPESPW